MPARWQQWIPFRIDAFKSSPAVQAMHPAARAGYIYLLLTAWQTEDCTVSSDPFELAENSGLGDELWAIYGPRILRKFVTVTARSPSENGTVTVERFRNEPEYEEWKEAKRVYDSRRNAAKNTNTERSPHKISTVTDTVTARSPSRSADTRTVTGTLTGTKEQRETRASAPPPEKPIALIPDETPVTQEPYDPAADPFDSIPEGLTRMQYATEVFRDVGISPGYALNVKLADTIPILAREEACSDAEAVRRLRDRMREAQRAGPVKWNFWLEDGGWKLAQVNGISTEGWEDGV